MACLRLRKSLTRDSVVLILWEECFSGKPLQEEVKQRKKRERDKGRFEVKSRLGLMPGGGFGPLPALKS